MEGREYFNRRDYERTGGQQGTPNTVWKLGIWDAFRGISTHLDRDSGEPLNPNSAEDTTQLATSFGKLADRYRLFAFTYPSYHRIPENGQELARQLGVAFPDAGSIVLVAHSMGGLVSRYAMNAPFGGEAARGLLGNKVAHLVTLATPHHGSLGESLSGYGRPLPDLAGSEMFRQGDEGSCWPLAVEPLAIVSGSLPQGSVGAAYGARLQALRATPVTWTVRGVASPVWSLAAGTLPVGLAVDPAGSVAGTPLQAAATVIQLGARNRGGSVTRPYELRFEAVELRETGLPAGDVGAAYEVRFFAAGRQPIDWSQGSGAKNRTS
jgi:hypothetical protein